MKWDWLSKQVMKQRMWYHKQYPSRLVMGEELYREYCDRVDTYIAKGETKHVKSLSEFMGIKLECDPALPPRALDIVYREEAPKE